jgi:hypothetical protein
MFNHGLLSLLSGTFKDVDSRQAAKDAKKTM